MTGRYIWGLTLRYIPAALLLWGCFALGVWIGGPLHQPTMFATMAACIISGVWGKLSDAAKLPTGWEDKP